MPVTINHILTATTPDNTSYEIRPSNWNSVHAGTMSATAGTEIFGAFSNDPSVNISFSTNAGGKVIASANVTAAPSPVNVTGNGSSVNAQTLAFTNSNGLTLGVSTAANAATITGSYTVPSTAGLLSAVNVSAGTTSNNLSALTFSNANGVSFGLNASTVTASVSQSAQTQASGGIAGSGFTSAGNNIGLSGTLNSGGLSLSATVAAQSVQTQASGNIAGSGVTTAGNNIGLSGTLNTAGLSLSATVAAQTVQSAIKGFGASNTGNTAGNTGISTGIDWVLAGSNNVTISESTAAGGPNTLWASGPTLTQYFSNTGTTFNGANISGSLTLNTAGLQASLSVAAGGGGNFSAGVSTGGNTSGNTGVTGTRVVFAGGNNITVSQGTDANGATITISGANAGGAQTGISGIQVSNTTYTSGTVTFQNANGISFGSSGANGISASYTVPTQTNQTLSVIVSSNTTGNTSGMTFDARSFSLQGYGNASVGLSTTNTGSTVMVSATQTVQTQASGAIAGTGFTSAGNNIGLSGTLNTAGLSLSATVAAQTNQTIGFYASSQTTGSASSGTLDARSVSIIGAGAVSVGMHSTSAGGTTTGFIISAPVQTNQTVGLYASSQTTAQSSSSTVDARSISIVGQGNISVGLSAGSFIISQTGGGGGGGFTGGVSTGGNTSGNTGTQTGQFILAGGNNITLSVGTAAGGAQTITVSAPNQSNQTGNIYGIGNTSGTSSGTYDARTLSIDAIGGAITVAASNSGWNLSVPQTSSLVGAGAISVSTNGSTISVSLGTGVTFGSSNTYAGTISTNGGSIVVPYLTRFFVRDPEDFTVLSAPGNASISFQYVSVPVPVTASRVDLLVAHSGSSSASNTTGGFKFSIYVGVYTVNGASLSSLSSGSTQSTYTWNSNSAGHTEMTQSNIIPISCPVNVNMLEGEYIVGVNFITATTGSAFGNTWSVMGGKNLQTGLVYAEVGSASNASVNLLHGMGVYSAASTGLSGAYSLSGIVQTGSSLSQANVALVFRNA